MERLKAFIKEKEKSGVRLGALHGVMVAVALLISLALLIASVRALEDFRNLQDITGRYITCQQNAIYFQEGSDYLTNECRYFAMTGDVAHAAHFMQEVEVTRRRDKAIEVLDDYLSEQASYDYLNQAMSYSARLAEVECYAMRLAAQAYGCVDQLPEGIRSITLRAEDAALDGEAQRQAAIALLYGEEYQQYKANIYECVEKSINALIEDTRQQQTDRMEALRKQLAQQRGCMVLLLVLLFGVVLLTYLLVTRPLRHAVKHINSEQEIPVDGSREMRFLAQAYNSMFNQQKRSMGRLHYAAMHDPLTGVHNRAAYEELKESYDGRKIGVLIIDVDKFKTYNDTYGHDVGDKVLKRVAEVLLDSFRSEDFVSRIGGDEFCVMMMRADSQMKELVERKIREANRRLQNPEDDLPPVSLSVGVAFSDRQNPEGDIFKDADTALYRVKRQGRGNCGFY